MNAGLGVINVKHESSECSHLFVTTDYQTWRAASPPTGAEGRACAVDWLDASFVSPTTGWVLGRVEGDDGTELFRTTDGAHTWTQLRGGDTAGNGGSEAIDFANSHDGIRQQFPDPDNEGHEPTVEHTTDGGTTFQTLSLADHGVCGQSGRTDSPPEVFANAADGVASDGFTGPSRPTTQLCETENGGATWTLRPLPSAGVHQTTSIIGTPVFWPDGQGVLPVDEIETATTAAMAFYRTTDVGRTWVLAGTEPVAAFTYRTVDGGTDPSFPSVSIVSPDVWWLAGHPTQITASSDPEDPLLGADSDAPLQVTADGGKTWTTVQPHGLPTHSVLALVAANTKVAWANTRIDPESDPQLMETIDGNATWMQIEVGADGVPFVVSGTKAPGQ